MPIHRSIQSNHTRSDKLFSKIGQSWMTFISSVKLIGWNDLIYWKKITRKRAHVHRQSVKERYLHYDHFLLHYQVSGNFCINSSTKHNRIIPWWIIMLGVHFLYIFQCVSIKKRESKLTNQFNSFVVGVVDFDNFSSNHPKIRWKWSNAIDIKASLIWKFSALVWNFVHWIGPCFLFFFF